MAGPLAGIKIIEIASIGPGPMCAMVLSDLGADIIRVDRPAKAGLGVSIPTKYSLLTRGRRSVAIDLKSAEGIETVLKLLEQADALIEGFRPGVMERLGLGPKECLQRNPKLIYGRMTGWGQEGPLAQAAGHDTNYIALVGVLHAIGRRNEPPALPINLIGDYGGGALYLAVGLLAGLLEAQKSGKGQVIDAAMVDGAAHLMTAVYGMLAAGLWADERGSNILDSGAHFMDVYETKDRKYISIASIEAKFYRELLERIGVDSDALGSQLDRPHWPAMKQKLQAVFKTKTRDEWCAILEGTDACFAPVLSLNEAPTHPHNQTRSNFVKVDGITQPAPAPRFSRTPGQIQRPPSEPGQHTNYILKDWGFSPEEIEQLHGSNAIVQK